MKGKKVLADLVQDFALYPRLAVDDAHVRELIRAEQAGETLPLIIVDKATSRIVDGFHRRRALIAVHGAAATVTVDLREYEDERALFEEAVRLNAIHGRRLDQQDRTRCALKLEEFGTPVQQIAVALSTTEDRIRKLLVNVVLVEGERKPAKPVLRSPVGQPPRDVSENTYAVAQSSSGWRSKQTITQLTNELRSGVIDLSDEEIIERLWTLADMITTMLPERETVE